MIEFFEKTHTYIVDGKETPSVTTVLNRLNNYSYIDKDVLARAAKFGTAVHKATELYDKNELDIDTLDAALLPYVEGWDLFLQDYKPDFLEIEYRISSVYGYAGTLDRYAKIKDYRATIDIKSGSTIPKTTGLQLAAYQQGLIEDGKQSERRFAVHLKPFDYKVINYKDITDFTVFNSALTLHKWERANA
jgi:hypothetical protein